MASLGTLTKKTKSDSMLRVTNLSNKFQKRLIRPLYAQTQAYPYAARLDDSLFGTGTGTPSVGEAVFRAPLSGDSGRSAAAFLYKGGLVPGTVMVLAAAGGDAVQVSAGGDVAAEQNFGLLANFVGGELDDLHGEITVGVWRGPDSVFEILAPGFNDSGLATAFSNNTTQATPVPLYAGTDGRLCVTHGSNRNPVAYLLDAPTATRIVVDLKV